LEIQGYKEHILLLETLNHSNRVLESFEVVKQRKKEELTDLMLEIENVKKRKQAELSEVDEVSAAVKKLKDDRTNIQYDLQQIKTQYANSEADIKELEQKRSAIIYDINTLQSDVMKLNDTRKTTQALYSAQHTAITAEMQQLNAQLATTTSLKKKKDLELDNINEQYESTKSVLSMIGDQLKKVKRIGPKCLYSYHSTIIR
jgi:chromosome segregation ATPase